jgi:cold shock CspA family protein
MLRARRKLACRRDTGTRQASEGIVEKNDAGGQANNFDDALQSAGEEFEEPSGPTVRGTVKWFSSTKGYGFVQLSDGSGDAFIHATALAGIGVSTLQQGETLELRMVEHQVRT